MRTIEGLTIRPLGKEYILTPNGKCKVDFNVMICLNSTAAFLWENVAGKDFTVETLSDLLVGEYEIDKELADKDSAMILEKWKEANLIVE